MPLDLPTLQSIRRMLRSGIRHAEIARRLDLAVGTISRIASVRRLRRLKLHLLAPDELPEDDPPPDYLAANLRRCPGCGGLVYRWPCLACRLIGERDAGAAHRTEWERGRVGEGETEGQRDGAMERPEYGRICCAGESSADCCAPKGQPEKAQGAALGSRSAHQHSAPTGRTEWAGRATTQRAPLGLIDASIAEIERTPSAHPGLRPGLFSVGPSGRSTRPLTTHQPTTHHGSAGASPSQLTTDH